MHSLSELNTDKSLGLLFAITQFDFLATNAAMKDILPNADILSKQLQVQWIC